MTDNLIIKKESLTAIADAIRKKTGKTDVMTLSQMKDEINGIETGSGVVKFEDLRYFYYNGSRLSQLKPETLDTSICTVMNNMFEQARFLTYEERIDLTAWDTSNVTNMFGMFFNVSNFFEANLSGWDTRKVTTMGYMFMGCKELQTLRFTGWDTNKVKNMSNFIYNCTKLKDVYIEDSELNADGQLKFKLSTSDVFDQIRTNGGKIHLSKTLESNYKSATNWSAYTDIMEFDKP